MIRRETNALVYFQFEHLAAIPGPAHGVTTRLGPPSGDPRGLNMSFAVAEQPADVVAARHAVCAALGLRLEQLVVPRQVHGKRVAVVGRDDRGRGALQRDSALPDCDGLVSAEAGVALFVSAADCVPILFFDPVHMAIGAAHAGWRGTVAKVAAATVATMAERYGTRPADLLVGIGPAIGPCCYEVGEAVVQEMVAAFGEAAKLILERASGPHLDLWEANRVTLLSAGVPAENIEVSGLCTACRTDLFFSHRAERGNAGRFAAIIALADSAGDEGADVRGG